MARTKHRYERYETWGDLFDHLHYDHGIPLDMLRGDLDDLRRLHAGVHA